MTESDAAPSSPPATRKRGRSTSPEKKSPTMKRAKAGSASPNRRSPSPSKSKSPEAKKEAAPEEEPEKDPWCAQKLVIGKRGLPIVVSGGPAVPSRTLYVRNLPERKGRTTLQRHLHRMFEGFGELVEVKVHRGQAKRGQAWVIFKRLSDATLACKEMQEAVLYGKTLIVQFAKNMSKEVAEEEDKMDEYEEMHKSRIEARPAEVEERRKKRKAQAPITAVPPPLAALPFPFAPPTLPSGPVPAFPSGLPPPPPGFPPLQPPAGFSAPAGVPALPVAPQPTAAPAGAMAAVPDDLVPPNPTLFVSGLPDSATQQEVEELFARFPGFKEVRLVPAKKGIAFVEYTDAESSGAAKRELHGHVMDGAAAGGIKVTFRK